MKQLKNLYKESRFMAKSQSGADRTTKSKRMVENAQDTEHFPRERNSGANGQEGRSMKWVEK
jgi:hypothetical protein